MFNTHTGKNQSCSRGVNRDYLTLTTQHSLLLQTPTSMDEKTCSKSDISVSVKLDSCVMSFCSFFVG